MRQTIHTLVIIAIALLIVASGSGVFCIDDGMPFTVISQYGNEITLYGKGIYKNDAAFLAPIFRGTDFVMLFVVVPLLTFFLFSDKKRRSFKSLLTLNSALFMVLYYAVNVAFGIVFNSLHLVYTALLSVTFFALCTAIFELVKVYSKGFSNDFKITNGLKIFIFVSGIALFGAWLPDIISAHLSAKPLSYLENYTTSVTYVLDMGFVSPLLFIALYLLKKRPFYGVCLLSMLLYLSMLIGIILPVQTWFQLQSGIEIPFPELLSKVLIFILLSVVSFYFNQRLFLSISER